MITAKEQIVAALSDFKTVALLAGEPIQEHEILVEFLTAPHVPPSRLPSGKMAIYGFWSKGSWLKIGKVGANSAARYTSQHYNAGSARSTLAGSLLACSELGFQFDANPLIVRDWIKANCCRANLLVPASRSSSLLSLLEAFLHTRLRPRYER